MTVAIDLAQSTLDQQPNETTLLPGAPGAKFFSLAASSTTMYLLDID
jgi:hypothetical protein